MRRILGCFIILIIMMTSQIFAGTVYYVDATNGNDFNDGLSPATARKTLAKVNNSSFSAGDSILFKRGEIWKEQLVIPSSGMPENPITLGAYGNGSKPIITSRNSISSWDNAGNWTNTSDNLWYIQLASDPCRIFLSDNEYIEAPNKAGITSTYRWWYDSDNDLLYVYATSNPATEYSNIEMSSQASIWFTATVDTNSKDYLIFENLDIRGADAALKIENSDYVIVDSCNLGLYSRYGVFTQGETVNTTSYCEVHDCTIDSGYSNAAAPHWLATIADGVIFEKGTEHCKIYDCIVSNWNHSGLQLQNVASGYICENNEMYDNDISASNTNYCRGIGCVGGAADYCKDNKFYRNYIHDTTINNQIQGNNNEFYYNIIDTVTYGAYSQAQSAPYDASGILQFAFPGTVCNDNKIYNNVIYNVYGDGIRVHGDAGYNNIQSELIRNNIIMNWDSGSIGRHGLRITDHATVLGCTYENNCFYKSGVSDVIYNGHGTGDDYPHTIAEFNAMNGTAGDVIGNNIDTNPLFVNTASGNFTVQITSPCIDAGIIVGLTRDHEGNTVPVGWGVDIGAYEYQDETPGNPVASFTAYPTEGIPPLDVSFDASASYDTDGNITSYEWDFGDGNAGSGMTTTHTYQNEGTYTAKLTVTDNDEHSASDSQEIKVGTPPVALFEASPMSGNSPLRVEFDASYSYDPDGNITSYKWDFGDGNISSGKTITHTYQNGGIYTAKLTVTDNDEQSASDSQEITVTSETLPVASFVASPTEGAPPLDVSFDASASYDPDGNITSYEWNFGDGNTGSGVTTTHTYQESGTFTAKLTVTDNDEHSASSSQEITVTGTGGTFPVALFEAFPMSGNSPLKVEFDASYSYDTNGEIVSYDWDFGDGTQGNGKNITHTYYNYGEHTATLNITDDDSLFDSISKKIKVMEIPYPPLNVKVTRVTNRGNSFPYCFCRVKWSKNPKNDGKHNIVKYRIYRKIRTAGDNAYVLIHEVGYHTFGYDDRSLEDIKELSLYTYAVSAIDDKNRESELGKPTLTQ